MSGDVIKARSNSGGTANSRSFQQIRMSLVSSKPADPNSSQTGEIIMIIPTRTRRMAKTLLAGSALALMGGLGAQRALAQTVPPPAPRAAVVFLPKINSVPSANCMIPGFASTGTSADAISGDGQVVVGNGNNSSCANTWRNGTPQLLNDPNRNLNIEGVAQASSVSMDGSIIVGDARGTGFFADYNPAVIWAAATGFYRPPEVISGSRQAVGSGYVNSNGTFFALNVRNYNPSFSGGFGQYVGKVAAYRWSSANGYEAIGSLGVRYDMVVSGIDGSGNAIVGTASDPGSTGADYVAFVWRSGGGLTSLQNLSNSPNGRTTGASTAAAISRNGSTIVGDSFDSNGLSQAVFWRGGAITGLGFIPGSIPASAETSALATNTDGSVIVGTTTSERAWRWTATSGIQDLNLIASNAGINLNGYILNNAVGVSDNGQYIAGNSFNTAQNQSLGYVLQLAYITNTRYIIRLVLPGVTQTSVVNQTFNTQVTGTLNGASVFTRSVNDSVTSAAGSTALADARTALQVNTGLRRAVVGAPTLLSNVTTVLSTTNAVVDGPTSTAVSTTTINTNGPATVITGDLGTCTTGVVGTTAPGGCTLPGTSTAVDPGVLNSNIYTATTNSVSSTITPTVNQLVTARWQVAATAGNQFGTVHALVGPVAFDRGDHLMAQLLSPTRTRTLPKSTDAQDGAGDNTAFGSFYNDGSKIDADANLSIARVSGQSNGVIVGGSRALSAGLQVGIALDHSNSRHRVADPLSPETLDIDLTQIGGFVRYSVGAFSLRSAAAFGLGTVKTVVGSARAGRDLKTFALASEAGYDIDLGAISVRPVIGVRYGSANLERFSESGGPSPLNGLAKTVTRTRTFLGVEGQGAFKLATATLTPRAYIRYGRDSGDASGVADVVFASAPNAAPLQAFGPSVGRNVTQVGTSLDISMGSKLTFNLSYDATSRQGASANTATARLTVAF